MRTFSQNCEQTLQKLGAKNINANFFCTKFFKNASGHGRPRQNRGRPHQKVRFSAAPVMGRNFLTQGSSGHKGQVSAGNPDQKVYVYAAFSSLNIIGSETFSTCNQHANFTFINSQEFHACISYMPAHVLGNDTHVSAMKNKFK